VGRRRALALTFVMKEQRMNRRSSCAMLSTICWFAMTAAAFAGPYDVTFQVPLNLTRMSPEITKIRVLCSISTTAITSSTGSHNVSNAVELPVSGSQVVTTANVVVPVTTLDTSNGNTSASYTCTIDGQSLTNSRWTSFDERAVGAFKLSPTPQPITGTFTW